MSSRSGSYLDYHSLDGILVRMAHTHFICSLLRDSPFTSFFLILWQGRSPPRHNNNALDMSTTTNTEQGGQPHLYKRFTSTLYRSFKASVGCVHDTEFRWKAEAENNQHFVILLLFVFQIWFRLMENALTIVLSQ